MTTKQLHQKTHHFVLLFLLLCVVGMTKSYAYDFSAVCETGQTLYYNITNAEYHYVELTYPGTTTFNPWGGYTKPTGNIVLPKYVYDANDDQYFLTSIGDLALDYCDGLTGDLAIPNFVTTIGINAFANCRGLTSITIPNSVTAIDVSAFVFCSGLEQIVVQSQNTVYDSRDNCNAIIETNTNKLVLGCKNTVIPNTVMAIGNAAFDGCSELVSIVIPNTVITIGDYAFNSCSGLMSVTIPDSVTTIGKYAFSSCSGLTSVTIPNFVTTIGAYAFYNCRGLTSIIIGNSVTTIDHYAFSYCIGLTLITIPNSVTTIGERAFFCSGLISVSIPNSVTSISYDTFERCSEIEQIIVESGNTVFDSRDNCNAIIHTSTNALIRGCKNTVIPNTVTMIGSLAFDGCSGLTTVTIPNSVTSIGGDAFYGCSGLTTVTIPNSVTSIGSNAFYGCSGLSSIIIQTIIPPILHSSLDNSLVIYVPYESLNAYKTATGWSDNASQIHPMAYKTILAHGESGGWVFIASPLLANTNPTDIDDMIAETESNFDLYRFNQSAAAEWENWKSHANNDDHYHFNLKNGQGYLYANAEDVNLIFKGTFNENSTKTINLIYEAGEPFAGWNLVGNPFPVAATVTGSSYYVMNEEGTGLNPTPVSSGGTIPACTGIMVHATVLGQPVTFSTSAPETQSQNNGMLQIAVAENARGNAIEDKAVISFNEGDALCKFVFNKDNAQISILQGGEDYAIACAEKRDEMPLNFKAAKNGSYTLSVNPEAVEMEYLHLIDNLTGNDVDLLVTPSYTFEAKTSDYASRFRLVFSVSGEANDNTEEPFAFISNGGIIVTGDYADATLQIVDMLGHVVVSTDVAGNVSTANMTPGVYVLRLVIGDNARTQKVVIR